MFYMLLNNAMKNSNSLKKYMQYYKMDAIISLFLELYGISHNEN